MNKFQQPLASHRYLGPLERYATHADGPSRYDEENKEANFAKGDENIFINSSKDAEDSVWWWIGGWLDSFVATHGSDKALTVLGKDYATVKQTK